MERLIALVNIQFKGKLYVPGEEMPAFDLEMADAWKRAKSVKVLDEVIEESPKDGIGMKSGADRLETEEGESKGETAGENASENQPEKEPDIKEPPKEGKMKK